MSSDRDESVQYSILTEADAHETAALLGRVFAERDPPAVAAAISIDEFEADHRKSSITTLRGNLRYRAGACFQLKVFTSFRYADLTRKGIGNLDFAA